MADPGASQSKSVYSHVTIMAALMMIFLGTFVQCDKKEVPSSPGSSFEFDDIDADRSGCVEGPEELQNFRIQVGRILGEALKLNKIERALRAGRITHSADINGDGRICQCDLLSILLTESTGPGVHRHAFRVYEDGSFFDDVDANGDGVLGDVSEREALTHKLAQCVPVDQARAVVEAMSKLDTDDGQLTRAEYLLFLESAQHQSDSVSDKSPSMPQPLPPQPQLSPQPQPMPPQPQLSPQPMPPQPQGIPQNQPQPQSPANDPLKTPTGGPKTPTKKQNPQGRPRKRLPPQPFLNPASQQPVAHPQPWNQPQPHYQSLMRAEEAASGQPAKAANPARQPLNQPAFNPLDQDEQNLGSALPRQRLVVNAKRFMTRFRYHHQQQNPAAFARAARQNPKRLENFYPGQLQPTMTKLERAGIRNQPYQPQPQPESRPAQSNLPEIGPPGRQVDLLTEQTGIASSPSQKSQPESTKKKLQEPEVQPKMKNLSGQLQDEKTKPQVEATVDKNLESELQNEKN